MAKKRSKGQRVPAYCEHKPTGTAYVRLTVDGKRETVQLGKYNSKESLARYHDVVAGWLTKREIPDATNGDTVQKLANLFKSHQAKRLNQDKFYNCGNALKTLCELFGKHPVDSFDGLQFDAYRDELIRRGYAREYGNRLIGIVVDCFRYGLKIRMVDAAQFASVQTIDLLTSKEAPTKIVTAIDDETVDETLPYLSRAFQDTVRFMRLTGCPEELAQMHRCFCKGRNEIRPKFLCRIYGLLFSDPVRSKLNFWTMSSAAS